MVKDVAIYGAGGFGREMALMIQQINEDKKQWNLLGFFDDGKPKSSVIENLSLLGGHEEANNFQHPLSIVVAIADSMARNNLVKKLKCDKIDYPVLIHPQCLSGSISNQFGRGSILTAGCILTTGIRLADFVIVNLSATIGHDVTLGSYSSVMPGANISGNVIIGERTLIGTGVKILQNLTIGNDCRIGAGAVVTKDVADGATVTGVPAKKRY